MWMWEEEGPLGLFASAHVSVALADSARLRAGSGEQFTAPWCCDGRGAGDSRARRARFDAAEELMAVFAIP
jgi:hypothetical protein